MSCTRKFKYKKDIDFVTFVLCIFVVIFPFVTYFHLEKLNDLQATYIANTNGYVVDFFLFYKEIVLVVAAGVIALHTFVGFVISGKEQREPIFNKNNRMILIFSLAGIFFVCCSTINAYINGQSETVWFGITTEYEGALALLAYMIMFIAGFNYVNTRKKLELFIKSILILSLVIGILAIVEYSYKPIYEISFMKHLIAPPENRSVAESLKNTSFTGQTALSFYNSGYLGGVCALLLPITIGQVVVSDTLIKRMRRSIIFVLLLIALITSNSSGALYGTIIGVVIEIVAICLLKRKKKQNVVNQIKKIIPGTFLFLIVFVIVFGGINLFSKGKLYMTVKKTLFHQESVNKDDDIFELDSLKLENGKIIATSGDKTIVISIKANSGTVSKNIKITDKNDSELLTTFNDNKLSVDSDGYTGVSFEFEEDIIYLDFGYEDTVPFYITDKGFCLVAQNGAGLETVPKPGVQGYEKYYHIATGRGYTWIQSIPELKKSILVGSGAGNFMYNFRQNEVVGLLNTHGSSRFVVDKPHNMYIEMAIEQGMLWTIVFVAMFILLMVKGLKVINGQYEEKNIVVISFVLGLLAFLITGVVNDSIVAVNPIFWIIYGVAWKLVQKEKPA